MRLVTILFTSFIIAACGVESDNQSTLQARTETVCDMKEVPSGWVITEVQWTHECGGGAFDPRTYYIEKAKPGLSVCHFSKIPKGYFRTSPIYRQGCSRFFREGLEPNSYTLKRK